MRRMLLATTVAKTMKSFLTPFAENFRQQGWVVDGMAQDATQCVELRQAFCKLWDVPWSRNPLAPCNLLKAPRKVRQIVADEGYDLVHVHTPVAAFVTRLALRWVAPLEGVKIVYTAHGFHFQKGRRGLLNAVFFRLEELGGKWTDSMVVINHDDYSMASEHRLVPPEKLYYMPGIGIDTDHYRRSSVDGERIEAVRAELGLCPHDRLLLMIAGFDPGKRHRDALEALARLGRDDIHLALAGGGPLQKQTEELCARMQLSRRVHFLGFRSDIRELICAADMVLLPSEREGLPRSLMEAQGLETLCIGTNIRGIRDLLEDGCGVLVEVGDAAGLSRAITHFLDHPQEMSVITGRARERIHNYELNKILSMHEELYARTLAPQTGWPTPGPAWSRPSQAARPDSGMAVSSQYFTG